MPWPVLEKGSSPGRAFFAGRPNAKCLSGGASGPKRAMEANLASRRFEQIVEDFEFLDDWEDRYRYVIELGKAMRALDPSLHTQASKVDGCASQVWIVPRIEGAGHEARIDFDGDSDALIVRGLIAVLKALYGGARADDVMDTDALAELGRLGLDQHLSSQRSNGLKAMVARIQAIAREALVEA